MTEVDSHIPEYTLEETEKEVVITVVAPLSKPKQAACVLKKDVFTFDSPPYLLKLKLPCPVSDRFSRQYYDNATGTYKIFLLKSYETWKDDSDEDDEVINPAICIKSEENLQKEPGNEEKQFYGFANMYSNMFGKLYSEFCDVINLPDPDYTKVYERRILREKEENEKWSDDHYLADTMETSHLQSIFAFQCPWNISPAKDELRNDEQEVLAELIIEEKINQLSKENVRLSEFQIVDILFSYAYNVRTTEGDNTVESSWTISKISATLSWLDVFDDLRGVILACYKRSLIFPLYRNWNLTEMIHKDVVNILQIGSKQITRCLLEVRDIFNDSGYCYILNTLFVNDLCNFAFHMTDERCLELSEELEKVNIKKSEMNVDLSLLEVAAFLTLKEENGSDELTEIEKIMDNMDEKILDQMVALSLGNERNSSSESEDYVSNSSESSYNED